MIFHKVNESRAHAAAVYLFDLDRLAEGPSAVRAPDPEGQYEYNLAAVRQQIIEFLSPGARHDSNNWGDNCYYCRPNGVGVNDDDVIVTANCTCWCHARPTLWDLQEKLEALL